jgi:hypothetical protein
LEKCDGNNVDEFIEVEVVVSATKVVLVRGANTTSATTTIVDLFGDGFLLLLLKMVDGLLGRVCIFWFFSFSYDFDLKQQDDGFWFLGLAEVQRVAMNLLLHLPGVGAMWNMNLPSLRCNGQQLHHSSSSNKVQPPPPPM